MNRGLIYCIFVFISVYECGVGYILPDSEEWGVDLDHPVEGDRKVLDIFEDVYSKEDEKEVEEPHQELHDAFKASKEGNSTFQEIKTFLEKVSHKHNKKQNADYDLVFNDEGWNSNQEFKVKPVLPLVVLIDSDTSEDEIPVKEEVTPNYQSPIVEEGQHQHHDEFKTPAEEKASSEEDDKITKINEKVLEELSQGNVEEAENFFGENSNPSLVM